MQDVLQILDNEIKFMKMRKILLFIPMLLLLFSSCEKGVDTSYSIFDDTVIKEKNEFDIWLDKYFVKPYNIREIGRAHV